MYRKQLDITGDLLLIYSAHIAVWLSDLFIELQLCYLCKHLVGLYLVVSYAVSAAVAAGFEVTVLHSIVPCDIRSGRIVAHSGQKWPPGGPKRAQSDPR